MRPIQKVISAGFATAALASASLPALSWTAWPDVDFEWYANVGKPLAASVETVPAPREGYTWMPGRYERQGAREVWVAGHWVRDDESVNTDAAPALAVRERDVPVMPTAPATHSGESARR